MTVTGGLALVLLAVGAFFLIVAALGFIRLPDVYCRLHVVGVIDTLGAPSVLLACAVYLLPADPLVSGKLVLAIVFLFATSPLVGHLLARAALEAGEEPEVASEAAERAPEMAEARRSVVGRASEQGGPAAPARQAGAAGRPYQPPGREGGAP